MQAKEKATSDGEVVSAEKDHYEKEKNKTRREEKNIRRALGNCLITQRRSTRRYLHTSDNIESEAMHRHSRTRKQTRPDG